MSGYSCPPSAVPATGPAALLDILPKAACQQTDLLADTSDRYGLSYKPPMTNTDALHLIALAAAESGDYDRARRCYEQGAALGDFACLHAVGYMHDVGEGVPENKTLAMKIYRKAWRLGSHASAQNIAVLYREQGRFSMMFRWYKRVAEAGDGSSHLEMAKCYLAGSGVRKNPQAALRCLAIAIGSYYISEYEREEAQALMKELSLRLV